MCLKGRDSIIHFINFSFQCKFKWNSYAQKIRFQFENKNFLHPSSSYWFFIQEQKLFPSLSLSCLAMNITRSHLLSHYFKRVEEWTWRYILKEIQDGMWRKSTSKCNELYTFEEENGRTSTYEVSTRFTARRKKWNWEVAERCNKIQLQEGNEKKESLSLPFLLLPLES